MKMNPVGNATKIEIKLTKLDGNTMSGSYEAEIRTSGNMNTAPDFYMKGKSSNLERGHADVSVYDKSGTQIIMTITRERREEDANIHIQGGDNGTYNSVRQEVKLGGRKYKYNQTFLNKCNLCVFGSLVPTLFCLPTAGLAWCLFVGHEARTAVDLGFTDDSNAVGNFSTRPFARPDGESSCCMAVNDTLISVDVSDASHWTVERKWAMLTTAIVNSLEIGLREFTEDFDGGV